MASIENRSRFVVTVPKRFKLTKTFTHSAKGAVTEYVEHLRAAGYEPELSRLNDSFAVRVRQVGYADQCLFAASEEEAVETQATVEGDRRQGLFINYTAARRVSFGDLIVRYLREEAPRHKGYEVEGYILNALLEEAGLPRVDLGDAYSSHKNPHPCHAGKRFRKPTGKKMRAPCTTAYFVRKCFADLVPEDFSDYVDDRCQSVVAATVSRELDLFAAICRLAIDTWRIPMLKSPMSGVKRPKYFNERDRRLTPGEEERLFAAAIAEDEEQSIALRLEALMTSERGESLEAASAYRRKTIVKAARAGYRDEANQTFQHVAMMETFISFQLMAGARRSETLSLTWANVDFASQSALIPESKNGRPRKLPLRSALIELLERLPRTSEFVFPLSVDAIRKAWARICKAASLVGDDELHVHDLRHEAISRVADAGSKVRGGASLSLTCKRSAATAMCECCCDIRTCARRRWRSVWTRHSQTKRRLPSTRGSAGWRRVQVFLSRKSVTRGRSPRSFVPPPGSLNQTWLRNCRRTSCRFARGARLDEVV